MEKIIDLRDLEPVEIDGIKYVLWKDLKQCPGSELVRCAECEKYNRWYCKEHNPMALVERPQKPWGYCNQGVRVKKEAQPKTEEKKQHKPKPKKKATKHKEE